MKVGDLEVEVVEEPAMPPGWLLIGPAGAVRTVVEDAAAGEPVPIRAQERASIVMTRGVE